MKKAMRQQKREVTDRRIICAMLDKMDTIYVGMHSEPAPYVVPLNFGYELLGDELVFYYHCAKKGYKLECLGKNPYVSVTASRFISYAGGSVKGHMHDYQSVMAQGIAQEISAEQEPDAFSHALKKLLIHNHRAPEQADTPAARFIRIWRIVCRMDDVSAKAEIVPHTPEETEFAPAVGDGIPLDESHILDKNK